MIKTVEQAKIAFHEHLVELHGDVDVCGYNMCAADVLKLRDPSAYQESFDMWCYSNDIDLDDLE